MLINELSIMNWKLRFGAFRFSLADNRISHIKKITVNL